MTTSRVRPPSTAFSPAVSDVYTSACVCTLCVRVCALVVFALVVFAGPVCRPQISPQRSREGMHRRYAPPSSPPLATRHAFLILPWCHVSCTAAGVRVLEGSEAVALEVAPDGASVRAVRLADGSTLRASALLLCSGAWLRVRTPSLSDSDSAVSTRVCSLDAHHTRRAEQ